MTASVDAQAAARTPSQDRVPDFFIVGHHKCGTTALYEMLRSHPQIYMPDVKEPWFFARDLGVRFQPASPLPETLDQYLSLFAAARPEQRVGEATPSYLVSRTAAASIADLQPDARIIAILREPASFLRSLHLQSVRNQAETETDLRKAIALEEMRRQGKAIPRDAMRPQGSCIQSMYGMSSSYVVITPCFHPSRCLFSSTTTSGMTTRRPYAGCCGSWKWTTRLRSR